ncbi:MAG: DUF362 domain-containing protein [Deltaproteobacteria bacterium]|nr:DUF362 domain-containing protein [Deltaproteobacteria bacterium]
MSKTPSKPSADSPREKPSRREVLQRVGLAGGVIAGAAAIGKLRWDRGGFAQHQAEGQRQVRDFRVKADLPLDMVVVRGAPKLPDHPDSKPATPEQLVQAALAAMGGIQRFVSRGDIVAIKPNIGWDRTPLHGDNTNPQVVAAMVKACYEAGAKRVVVTDASCNEPSRCFQRSGIWNAAYAVGAEVVLPTDHRFRTMRLRGDVLDEWPVYTPLVNADKVINLPIAKHHNLSKYTAAMKNWYGVLGGRRNRLHQSIDVSIADLATFMRPTLTVVDAVRVLMRNGPQGGNLDDAREQHTLIASIDQVAADAWGCQLIGQTRENLAYLKLAEERGIGTMMYEKLRMKEISLT